MELCLARAIENGHLDDKGSDKDIALGMVKYKGYLEVVKYLVDKGPDINKILATFCQQRLFRCI